MSMSILTYLSLTKDINGIVTLNDEHLRTIRDEFKELNKNNDPDDEVLKETTLKTLARQLRLNTDQRNIDYLNICVKDEEVDDAKLEISIKYRDSTSEIVEPIIPIPVPITTESTKQKKSTTTKKQPKKLKNKESQANRDNDDKCKQLDEITCIINKKLNRSEVDDLMKEFLFRRVQQEDGQAVV
ncbi:unnamed protein product [Didymodactylos carnosus]|uniref:Uncharacterized protein n=1 Tax=Didymodactylos carnosus TaxID=1234261 RepID=A0A814W5C3_9BILA|nr:unnamed protein product [Didymodactylos carnosus]CAF3961856.1 unnamed protein product [Didymodactylos carnosus]